MEAMTIYAYTKKTLESKIEEACREKRNTFLMGGSRHYIEAAGKAIKNYEVTVVRQSPIGLDFEIRFRDLTYGYDKPRDDVFIWSIIDYIKNMLSARIELATSASPVYI